MIDTGDKADRHMDDTFPCVDYVAFTRRGERDDGLASGRIYGKNTSPGITREQIDEQAADELSKD